MKKKFNDKKDGFCISFACWHQAEIGKQKSFLTGAFPVYIAKVTITTTVPHESPLGNAHKVTLVWWLFLLFAIRISKIYIWRIENITYKFPGDTYPSVDAVTTAILPWSLAEAWDEVAIAWMRVTNGRNRCITW